MCFRGMTINPVYLLVCSKKLGKTCLAPTYYGLSGIRLGTADFDLGAGGTGGIGHHIQAGEQD